MRARPGLSPQTLPLPLLLRSPLSRPLYISYGRLSAREQRERERESVCVTERERESVQPTPVSSFSSCPDPTLYTPHPTPYTPHPTPYTLHTTPGTPHPTPYTLHLTPCTPHPTPSPHSPSYTLAMTSCTINPEHPFFHPPNRKKIAAPFILGSPTPYILHPTPGRACALPPRRRTRIISHPHATWVYGAEPWQLHRCQRSCPPPRRRRRRRRLLPPQP